MRVSHQLHGFTLIEVILASIAAALVMAAIYGVFQHAINMRDSDTSRIAKSRERLRATDILRTDLRNAIITGGTFGSILEGDATSSGGSGSSYPGFLEFTTTTGKDTSTDLYGDIQQVEYYVITGTATSTGTNEAPTGGILVRATTRDLLDQQPQTNEQNILQNVQSFQVAFYDGTNWQTSWNFNTADNPTTTGSSGSMGSGATGSGASATGSNSTTTSSSSSSSNSGSGVTETLPVAIRVDIQQAPASVTQSPPPVIEVTVPWTVQPFSSPSPSASASP